MKYYCAIAILAAASQGLAMDDACDLVYEKVGLSAEAHQDMLRDCESSIGVVEGHLFDTEWNKALMDKVCRSNKCTEFYGKINSEVNFDNCSVNDIPLQDIFDNFEKCGQKDKTRFRF